MSTIKYWPEPEKITPFEGVAVNLYGYVEKDDRGFYTGKTRELYAMGCDLIDKYPDDDVLAWVDRLVTTARKNDPSLNGVRYFWFTVCGVDEYIIVKNHRHVAKSLMEHLARQYDVNPVDLFDSIQFIEELTPEAYDTFMEYYWEV